MELHHENRGDLVPICELWLIYLYSYLLATRSSLAPDPFAKKKRKSRAYIDEVYTDKDRAAAVSHGLRDNESQMKHYINYSNMYLDLR